MCIQIVHRKTEVKFFLDICGSLILPYFKDIYVRMLLISSASCGFHP